MALSLPVTEQMKCIAHDKRMENDKVICKITLRFYPEPDTTIISLSDVTFEMEENEVSNEYIVGQMYTVTLQ